MHSASTRSLSARIKIWLLAAAGMTAATAVFMSFLASRESTTVPAFAALFIRWLSISLLIAYTISRRTLTPWVLVSLLAGAELGHDWPSVAMQLQFLGAIFIRLIKAIVAPLLFGTLVVGIAGHGDLRKVRRLGIKSLVYFEIVSTIAMLLGFAAINISRAGESIQGFATTVTRSTAA